jgi:hypothetical protein
MTSAAEIAGVPESAGPRPPRRKLALRRNPLRRPPAELGSTAPQPPRGRSRENRQIGKTEVIITLTQQAGRWYEKSVANAAILSLRLP